MRRTAIQRRPKRLTPAQDAYLRWLRQQECVAAEWGECEGRVEAAHVKGCRSTKSGALLPRRMGEAMFCAVPACERHHRWGVLSIHETGERLFFEHLAESAGQASWGYGEQLVISYLCRYLGEGLR